MNFRDGLYLGIGSWLLIWAALWEGSGYSVSRIDPLEEARLTAGALCRVCPSATNTDCDACVGPDDCDQEDNGNPIGGQRGCSEPVSKKLCVFAIFSRCPKKTGKTCGDEHEPKCEQKPSGKWVPSIVFPCLKSSTTTGICIGCTE